MTTFHAETMTGDWEMLNALPDPTKYKRFQVEEIDLSAVAVMHEGEFEWLVEHEKEE